MGSLCSGLETGKNKIFWQKNTGSWQGAGRKEQRQMGADWCWRISLLEPKSHHVPGTSEGDAPQGRGGDFSEGWDRDSNRQYLEEQSWNPQGVNACLCQMVVLVKWAWARDECAWTVALCRYMECTSRTTVTFPAKLGQRLSRMVW